MFLLPQLPQLLWRVGGSYGKTFTLAYLSDPFGTRDILIGKNIGGGDFPKKNSCQYFHLMIFWRKSYDKVCDKVLL